MKSAIKAKTSSTCCYDHDISDKKYHNDWNESWKAAENEGDRDHDEVSVREDCEEVNEMEGELTREQLIWRKRQRDDKDYDSSVKKRKGDKDCDHSLKKKKGDFPFIPFIP